jgi:hypothetical protein
MGCPTMGTAHSFYPNIFLRSASGVLIGVIPNFSTKTLKTLGERNAGRDGPM